MKIDFPIPAGYHSSTDAPVFVSWSAGEGNLVQFGKKPEEIDFSRAHFPLEIPVRLSPGSTEVIVDAVVYFCKENSSLCMFEKIRVKAPVAITGIGAKSLEITAPVNPKPKSGI
jgi:hypothetical protein